ncbi:hypothetical protein B0H14DRAFT_3896331 [Mycena olivaceomarginata]|nr:hypothetical protein B0H14DRAFT_3896331 [Mycena olivaceomarginata]
MKFSATFVALSFIAVSVSAHELPSRSLPAPWRPVVTGPCTTDSDCQQGCCAFNTGKCAGPAVAQTRDGGCGFGSGAPNCNVAKALGLSDCAPGAVNGNLADPAIQSAAAFVAKLDNLPFTPAAGGAAPAAAAPAAAAPRRCRPIRRPARGRPAEQEDRLRAGSARAPTSRRATASGGCGHGNAAPNCDVATPPRVQELHRRCCAGNLQDAAVQGAAAFAAQLDNLPFTPSK